LIWFLIVELKDLIEPAMTAVPWLQDVLVEGT
jgi:hypothetical protein